MKKWKLAIVGRPNVGKSALFNRLCRERIAIVDDAEGTTRDRVYGEADLFGQKIDIIDTGGISSDLSVEFQKNIQEQVAIALSEADAVILVVDGRTGVVPADEAVAALLRLQDKPICIAVNKIDDGSMRDRMYEFYSLGIESVLPVSAIHGYGVVELLETALSSLSQQDSLEETVVTHEAIRVAIVGRPNVGKSTLLNSFLAEERSIVHPSAGTTRDAIDVTTVLNGHEFILIDTAGIRRKHAENDTVSKFAAIRTERAIQRAHVCLLLIDAQEGLTTRDKQIARRIEQEGKGCILVFNKWDLIQGYRMEHCLKAVRQDASFLSHCPTLFVSALRGKNLSKLPQQILEVRKHQIQRISTGKLNKFIEQTVQQYHPPMLQGKRLKIFYLSQVETQPPTFVLFVNHPKLMVEAYKKYLIGKLRETYHFTGTPLHLVLKARRKAPSPQTQISRE